MVALSSTSRGVGVGEGGEGLGDLGLVDAIVVGETDADELGPVEAGPEEIRPVAYEVLVGAPTAVAQAPVPPPPRLFG